MIGSSAVTTERVAMRGWEAPADIMNSRTRNQAAESGSSRTRPATAQLCGADSSRSTAEPDHAAFQRFGGDMQERLAGCGFVVGAPLIFKDAGDAGQAVYAGIDEKADFVDQPLFQKRAIDDAAALEKHCVDAESVTENVHRVAQIMSVRAGEQIGDAVFAQLGQVAVRDLLADDGDD